MTPQLAALKELALKATRGPWEVSNHQCSNKTGIQTTSGVGVARTSNSQLHRPKENMIEDAAYIAAASPDVILSLIEKLEVATKALEFYANEKNWFNGNYESTRDSIANNDFDLFDKREGDFYKNSVGGKRAREALEKLDK